MTIAQDFIKKLQDATGKEPFPLKFWEDSSSHVGIPAFQDVLDKYAEYYSNLSPAQKDEMSKLFWEQIKAVGGTPIIEDHLGEEPECVVYFLMPKDNLSASEEVPGTKKDLYLQGDFHGYGSTDGRQRLLEFSNTGIMRHKDNMPKESIATYSYIQVEPGHRGKKPLPELPPFFEDGEGFIPHRSNIEEFPEIPQSGLGDEFSTHSGPYGFNSPERIFRVSADSTHAHISVKPVDWPSLLSTEISSSGNTRHFVYNSTLYSDKAGELHHSDAPVTNQYHDDLHYSNGYNLSLLVVSSFSELDTMTLDKKPYLIKDEEEGKYKIWGYKEDSWQLSDIELTDADIDSLKIPSEWKQNQTVFVSITDALFNSLKEGHIPYLPYADFTRDIHVFKPASGTIDDIIVVNDGIPYLMTGILDHFEKMVDEQKLSPNTAFVFINALPGLKTTLNTETAQIFDEDSSAKLPGMGVRLIDYKYGIDQYTNFIANKLLPQLKNEINVPDDPGHRVMIGSSLSGTASVYIGSKCPELFGGVIALSPSPNNRAILSNIPSTMQTGRNIYLGCGEFEQPKFAAANDNLSYANELSIHLGKELKVSAYGHQFVAWEEKLEDALPALALSLQASQIKITSPNQPLPLNHYSFWLR